MWIDVTFGDDEEGEEWLGSFRGSQGGLGLYTCKSEHTHHIYKEAGATDSAIRQVTSNTVALIVAAGDLNAFRLKVRAWRYEAQAIILLVS